MRRAQADDQVHVIAQNGLFEQMNTHFSTFCLKELSKKLGDLAAHEWLTLTCDKDDMIVKGVAVVIGFMSLVDFPRHWFFLWVVDRVMSRCSAFDPALQARRRLFHGLEAPA